MKKTSVNIKGQLVASHLYELEENWVRISQELRNPLPSRSYVRIRRVDTPKRSVFCQIRGTPNESGLIKMSEWFRDALGWGELDPYATTKIELIVESVGWCGRLRALLSHPNDTLRVGFGLGLTGIGIGLFGLGLDLAFNAIETVRARP